MFAHLNRVVIKGSRGVGKRVKRQDEGSRTDFKKIHARCCWCDDEGFEGKKCEKLSSVSLRESDAYVSLPPLSHRPHSNVTLLLSTRQKQGVILYHGVDEHLAVELFLGRLRVSYNIGNYPVSTMFSYEQLSDG